MSIFWIENMSCNDFEDPHVPQEDNLIFPPIRYDTSLNTRNITKLAYVDAKTSLEKKQLFNIP
jgi:hypothetical protein